MGGEGNGICEIYKSDISGENIFGILEWWKCNSGVQADREQCLLEHVEFIPYDEHVPNSAS